MNEKKRPVFPKAPSHPRHNDYLKNSPKTKNKKVNAERNKAEELIKEDPYKTVEEWNEEFINSIFNYTNNTGSTQDMTQDGHILYNPYLYTWQPTTNPYPYTWRPIINPNPHGEPIEEERRGIKDTGQRTLFDTGAEKDLGGNRGRYDLLPLETLSLIYKYKGDESKSEFLRYIYESLADKEINNKVTYLIKALKAFIREILGKGLDKVVPDIAILYEKGAAKYAERDWEKGRPMIVYINSTLRHFFQAINGENDEDHYSAVVWNLLSCIDTIRRLPKLAYTLDIITDKEL